MVSAETSSRQNLLREVADQSLGQRTFAGVRGRVHLAESLVGARGVHHEMSGGGTRPGCLLPPPGSQLYERARAGPTSGAE